ncbi:isoprenoid biosynthesis glyoxalase ElbB [Vibrio panuliri]|uniref:Glyoxalase n=1 Tax=Vibrio panuliri TaxID=1381081 RepID=A0ABX3FFA3_9VIBR|nr:isoprenoid biosynthesis glyoxalase ElbB [Vibrio panuliri]KAB1457457.1 isoprenoid biosynthesis glyoxalase ElbB [Vibrio panuliri]OLQ91383.1 isoprenoid biosynthesis protein ElbB [Vibrio panuliri]
MKKVAVILSGSGVFDGAEIHEAVLCLLALEQNGASWHCFAPDIPQHHVLNHITGEEMDQTRNVLVESARIARGNIQDITQLNAEEYDALLLPGGFGVAKNLSDFAFKGANCSINPNVTTVCKRFAELGKPAGYVCIAPALIPFIYDGGVKGTIGQDADTESAFNAAGGEHVRCQVDQVVYDERHNVFSTPAYMLAQSISEAASGINKLVAQLVAKA